MLRGAPHAVDWLLYEVGGERIVVKDFNSKPVFWRNTGGALLIAREASILAIIEGVRGVSHLRGGSTATRWPDPTGTQNRRAARAGKWTRKPRNNWPPGLRRWLRNCTGAAWYTRGQSVPAVSLQSAGPTGCWGADAAAVPPASATLPRLALVQKRKITEGAGHSVLRFHLQKTARSQRCSASLVPALAAVRRPGAAWGPLPHRQAPAARQPSAWPPAGSAPRL